MSTDRPPPQPPIHGALGLDGDPETLRAYYARWAQSYDRDLEGDYVGCQVIAELVVDIVDGPPSEVVVADVGCGTGLVGARLFDAGFTTIDGMDLSPEMVAEAEKLGRYRALHAGIDIGEPVPDAWRDAYDVVVCCGVFTPGHVDPPALRRLVDMTRPGGHVFTSTRTTYYDETSYQSVTDELEESGIASLVASLRDAPYTDDGDAHYWAYRVH